MQRCYGCAQENCDIKPCDCWCHKPKQKIQIDLSDPDTRATFESAQQAKREVASWPAWKRGEVEKPSCSKHRRYQAKRKPRVPCEACWRMYITKHPE